MKEWELFHNRRAVASAVLFIAVITSFIFYNLVVRPPVVAEFRKNLYGAMKELYESVEFLMTGDEVEDSSKISEHMINSSAYFQKCSENAHVLFMNASSYRKLSQLTLKIGKEIRENKNADSLLVTWWNETDECLSFRTIYLGIVEEYERNNSAEFANIAAHINWDWLIKDLKLLLMEVQKW